MMGKADGFPYPSLTGDELEAMGFDRDGRRASTDKQIYDELDRKLGKELRRLIDERALEVAGKLVLSVLSMDVMNEQYRHTDPEGHQAHLVDCVERAKREIREKMQRAKEEKS